MPADIGPIAEGTTLVDGGGDPCYDVLRLIGEGGYARTYLVQVRDPDKASQAYVIKVPNDPRRSVQFAREAWWGRVCRNRGIVACCWLDHTIVGGRRLPIIVMPFIMRGSMANRIHNRDYSVKQAIGWIRRVATVMSAFPGIHRDLKPDNLLFMDDEPLISDFGLAIPLTKADCDLWGDRVTNAGTLIYMAPEQATKTIIDQRADIYALGVILHELIAPEFRHDMATGDLIQAKVTGDLQLPETGHRGIDTVVRRCTRCRPADRYQTYAELIEDLDRAAQDY